jgi:putative acetyltransferase
VEACLEQLRASGRAGVVVVGHPGYYPRFGFIPASRWGLRWQADVPDEVFMALELSPGQLSEIRGVVRYRPEFGLAG